MGDTTTIRVSVDLRWAAKIAAAEMDCTIDALLWRVGLGDKNATEAYHSAVRYVAKRAREDQGK